MRWFSRLRKKPDRITRIDTSELIARQSARRLFRMHLSATFLFGIAAVLSFVGMAGFVYRLQNETVDHVLKLKGVLQAVQQSTPVTHETGGIVSNVFVSEGEVVLEGQVLMSLDASDIESQYIEAQRRVASLMLRAQCIQSLLVDAETIEIPAELKISIGRLNQMAEMKRSLRDCRGQLRQRALDLMNARENRVFLQSQIQIYSRLSHADGKIRGHLSEVSQVDSDAALQEVLMLQSLIDSLKSKLSYVDLQNKLVSLKVKQESMKIAREKVLNNHLDSTIDEMMLAERRLTKLEKIKKNRFIYAANSGRIQQMHITKAGKRIDPGTHLMEIAPISTDFEVFATVSVPESQYLRAGQAVSVYLSSGPSPEIAIPAKVTRISKETEDSNSVNIEISREELNRRKIFLGDDTRNGMGERAEALIEVETSSAFKALETIIFHQQQTPMLKFNPRDLHNT